MDAVGLFSRFVTTLFIAILSLVLAVQAHCPECTKLNIDNTKIACQYLAKTLVDTETDGNATHVCSALHELMLCVVDKTPQCLDTLGQQYKSYRMTPWMCQLTADQTILYQERHEHGCKQNYDDESGTHTVVQSNVAEVYQSNTSDHNSSNLLRAWCWPIQFVVTWLILQFLIYS